jgi:pyruvate/2-oxoglutarate dehydrogenase complex dihydrolipoamide acyltransferase (E2) component
MASVRLPDLGGTAVLTAWYVRVGEHVVAGDRVAEVSFPGIVVDITADTTGLLTLVHKFPGDRVEPGDTLADITEE